MFSRYGIGRNALVETFQDLIALANVTVSNDLLIPWAIGRFAAGADLADMIHLVAARATEAFVTFGRGVAPSAGDDPPLPVEKLA